MRIGLRIRRALTIICSIYFGFFRIADCVRKRGLGFVRLACRITTREGMGGRRRNIGSLSLAIFCEKSSQ